MNSWLLTVSLRCSCAIHPRSEDFNIKIMRYDVILLALCVLLAPIAPAHSQTATDELIDQLRRDALENLNPDSLGAGYAAMLSLAVSPDISAATFYPDPGAGIDDTRLKVFKLPIRHVFNREGEGVRPFVQGLFAYQTLDAEFNVLIDESIRSDWRTVGGALSAGVEIPLREQLSLLTAVTFGIGRLQNEAVYNGAIAENFIQPALAGLAFDWEARAHVYGASIAADYRRKIGNFDLEVHGSLTHHEVKTYDSSNEFIAFDTGTTTLDIDVNSVHPTSLKLADAPLSLVLLVGNTTFLGPNRDALDFDSFFELGAAIEADVSARGWRIKTLRFGAKAIVGENVTGWSLVVGHSF